jgi:hypothetical protein
MVAVMCQRGAVTASTTARVGERTRVLLGPGARVDRGRIAGLDSVSQVAVLVDMGRVLAMNALALSGKAGDIAQIKRVVASEHDPEIVRGALAAVARVSRLDAATETVVAARHPVLSQTVTYLKGRRSLPSLIDRGRAVPVRRLQQDSQSSRSRHVEHPRWSGGNHANRGVRSWHG